MIYVSELVDHTSDQIRPILRKHGRRWGYLWSDVSHAELDDFAGRIGLSRHYLADHPRTVRRCYWVESRWRERALRAGAQEATVALRATQVRDDLNRVQHEKDIKRQADREQGAKGGAVNVLEGPERVAERTPVEVLRNALPDAVAREYPPGGSGDAALQHYLDIWVEPKRAARVLIGRHARIAAFGERGATHEPSHGPPGERHCWKCRLKEPYWNLAFCWDARAQAERSERERAGGQRAETRAVAPAAVIQAPAEEAPADEGTLGGEVEVVGAAETEAETEAETKAKTAAQVAGREHRAARFWAWCQSPKVQAWREKERSRANPNRS